MAEDYADKWAVVSLLLVFFAVLGYFGYMMHYSLLKTPMDVIVKFALPMGILPLVAFFLSSEILGCRKFRRPRKVCLKRFVGRIFLDLGLMSILYLSLVVIVQAGLLNTQRPGSLLISVLMAILVGWSTLALLIVTRFREAVRRLTEGLW
jgi:hypothetical protein